jgi:hypothetical protein
MELPKRFDERGPVERMIGPIVISAIFGIVTGMALGWNPYVFWILAGPIAILGGILGAMEHRGADEGTVRGACAGLVFGSFALLGLEILDNEPVTYLSEPQVGFVFGAVVIGAIGGAIGGTLRTYLEARESEERQSSEARPDTGT